MTKKGVLVIKGEGVFSGKHHYAAYLEDNLFKYGLEKKKKISEVVDLTRVKAVEKDEEDRHKFNIFLTSKDKKKYRTDTTPERDSWVTALKKVALRSYEE